MSQILLSLCHGAQTWLQLLPQLLTIYIPFDAEAIETQHLFRFLYISIHAVPRTHTSYSSHAFDEVKETGAVPGQAIRNRLQLQALYCIIHALWRRLATATDTTGDDGQAWLQSLNCWAPRSLLQSFLSLCAWESLMHFISECMHPYSQQLGDDDYSCIIVDQTCMCRAVVSHK